MVFSSTMERGEQEKKQHCNYASTSTKVCKSLFQPEVSMVRHVNIMAGFKIPRGWDWVLA